MSARKVPRIDLEKYLSGDTADRRQSVDGFGDALRELGFVRVLNHGVPQELIDDVYAGFEEFFALDEETKRTYGGVAGGARGYTPFAVEHAKGRTTPDLKEFYHVGQELPEDDPLAEVYPENVWPDEVPGLQDSSMRLYRALEEAAFDLLESLAVYFGLPEDRFVSMACRGNSVLRILHYPPVSPEEIPEGATRAAEHEDINLITVLPAASDSGLEILTRDGEWLPVNARSEELVVDSGDMLGRVTNDAVPATTHRVVVPEEGADRHRYSMPFFVHARPECDLTVMEEFVSETRPPGYPPITAGEYLEERLREIGLVEEVEEDSTARSP